MEIDLRRTLLALALTLPGVVPNARADYFRHPDIHGDRIVFCAEADLWVTSDRGGGSRRLTTHPGTEYFPRFSPDGRSIAFTGEYDGNREVFIIDSEGGEPRRLTWHPASDEVLGWTPDGLGILFRSSREEPNGAWEIFSVPARGGDAEKLPLGWAARIDVDPDSGRWAFTRSSWETATWKRYRGGTAPDIWVGHPERGDFERVTESAAGDAFPMWHDGRIYFLSDQGGTQNIWSIRPDGSGRRRHTKFEDWDAKWPGMGPDGRIVFTLAADIHVFDPEDDRVSKLDVELPSDRTLTRVRYPDPQNTLSWFELAPEADRLVVVTRGEIFSVPVKEGVTLPVTRGSGARESWASFDAEGKRLVYVTDAPSEEEIRVIDAWGREEPKVVKRPGKSGWHFPPAFSPDGKWITYADQTQALYVIPAAGGTPKEVDRSNKAEIREYAWSPDGRWLAYSKMLETDYASIHLYDTRLGKSQRVTGPTTNDHWPAWDPEGRYLYFISDRATNPVLDSRDWQNIEARADRIYLVLLRRDVKNPVARLAGMPLTEAEEREAKQKEAKAKEAAAGKSKDKAAEDKPTKSVEIDLEGLADRFVELPIDRGRYWGLGAKADKIFYLSAPLKGMAEVPDLFDEPQPENTLMVFSLEDKESKPFMEGTSAYSLAAKADKIAIMKKRGEIYVVDTAAPPDKELDKSKVAMDGIVVELDPREEWEQIFHESWRHMRDFYWDSGMGGVDWAAERERYASLLPRLANREDLRDLLGELIGELGTSHTYVWGGDPGRSSNPVPTGLLGAQLERDGDVYRVARIYRADPADNIRSPLLEPGTGLAEGHYILAINHKTFPAGRPYYATLEKLAGKEVVLTVNDRRTRPGSREIVVKTLTYGQDSELRYSDWVRRNREYVSERTQGKIGYIHLPDMWKEGLIEFNTWFYPQLDREGMVVDVRWNGGGAVSQMILERFRRHLVSFDRARGGGISTYPYRVLNGPFVVITNEFAGSDGDIFPMAVQLEGLAPVIGMRSWGGVVGIRADKLLVDGGILTQPEFAWWDPKQGWDLENRGVVPDIELQNLPQDLARGIDAQLDRAIREVLQLHREHPPVPPAFGPVRDRSRKAFREEQ